MYLQRHLLPIHFCLDCSSQDKIYLTRPIQSFYVEIWKFYIHLLSMHAVNWQRLNREIKVLRYTVWKNFELSLYLRINIITYSFFLSVSFCEVSSCTLSLLCSASSSNFCFSFTLFFSACFTWTYTQPWYSSILKQFWAMVWKNMRIKCIVIWHERMIAMVQRVTESKNKPQVFMWR